jgi:uncharacterized phage protein gp47/JayE
VSQGPPYGFGPGGFTRKPTAQILLDMQTFIHANLDDTLDLTNQTSDGQLLAIVANELGAAWDLIETAAQQYDRTETVGAGLDSIGDITGTPRESQSYTQAFCTCALAAGSAPYAARSLVASIAGFPALTFSNANAVAATDISGGSATVLFECTTVGATAAPAPGTLTAISAPVTGWTAITNPPPGYFVLGSNEELDPAYIDRQAQEIANLGSCTPAGTAAQLIALGASQQPPVTLTVVVVENTTDYQQTVQGVSLAPHSYCVVVNAVDDSFGWASSSAGLQEIGSTLWANKPSGIAMVGTTSVTVNDAVLGEVTVYFTIPTAEALFVTAVVEPRPTYQGTFAALTEAIQEALVAAAAAPTLASGIPPTGQLVPGSIITASQLLAIIVGVPGVLDVYGPGGPGSAIAFDTHSSPTQTSPLPSTPTVGIVLTISAGTVSTNVVLTQA